MDMTIGQGLPFRQRAENEALFLETCDGGDPGTPDRPSTWLFGIEPGWSLADQRNDAGADLSEAAARAEALHEYGIPLQMQWPFNRNAFKLLAALAGHACGDYRAFAERAQPFVRGSTGYLKGNLFPEPFHNVGAWDDAAVQATGFATKADYQAWMRASRFAVMRHWIERCRPQLLIGVGITYARDFLQVTGAEGEGETIHFEVNGHAKRVIVAADGLVPLVVVPHLSGGANGLNSHRAIELAAALIRDRVTL